MISFSLLIVFAPFLAPRAVTSYRRDDYRGVIWPTLLIKASISSLNPFFNTGPIAGGRVLSSR
jgi:hypothetical protein